MSKIWCCLLLCSLLPTACKDAQDGNLLSDVEQEKEVGYKEITVSTRVSTDDNASSTEKGFPLGSRFRMDIGTNEGWQTMMFQRTDGGWQTTGDSEWDFSQDSTEVVALYPACQVYDTATLYDAEGGLTDLLYAHQRVATGQPITLSFQHLFSRLTIEVDASLRESIASVGVVVPIRITEVTLPSQTVSQDMATTSGPLSFTTDAEQSAVATQTGNGSASYTFLVPSGQRLALGIHITTQNGRSETRPIASTLFEAGHTYSCSLSATESAVGIHSVAEFMEFVNLYNDSRSKAVTQYGIERDGRTVFRVLNDLDFSSTDMTDFNPLGFVGSEPFKDVLDGMNHTLSGITFNENRCGLISRLSAEGEICNLTLDQCTATVTTTNGNGYGLLTNEANGAIRNCHVDRSTLTVDSQQNDVGVWAGVLTGYAVNCTTYNCSLQSGQYAGAVGQLRSGRIVNCAIERLNLNGPQYCGSFFGNCNPNNSNSMAYILNSTVYATRFKGTTLITSYGYLGGTAQNLGIQYCYYPVTTIAQFGSYANCKGSHLRTYDTSTFTTDENDVTTSLIDLLNQWTANHGYVYNGYFLSAWSLSTGQGVFTLQ